MFRRQALTMALASLAALALTAAAPPAHAQQDYPNKPVRVVVPYPPGGPTDIVARLVFTKVGELLGQNFIVDNRPGAGGNIGAELAAKATPDGYTVLLVTTAHAINPFVFKKLSYDIRNDFVPVSLLTQGPLVLVVNPTLPYRNVLELVNDAKTNPGKLSYASSGNGQSTHLSGELFNLLAGTKLTHVPYKGSAPALADVVAGQVQMTFDPMLSAMPFVKAGKLRALAVTSAQRSPSAPDIPTLAEAGIKGYESAAFFGAMVPAGTPAPIVEKLNQSIKSALADSGVAASMSAQGFAPSYTTSAAFSQYMNKELDKWQKTVAASGATID